MLQEVLHNYAEKTKFLAAVNSLFMYELDKDKHAQKYLFETRAFNSKSITKFKVGVAPTVQVLVKFVEMNNLNVNLLFDTGLIFNDKDNFTVGRLDGRITFPIMDFCGNIVAFSGRQWNGSALGAKYVNSATSNIFRKALALYGMSIALNEIKKRRFVVLVEGNFDVIRLSECGILNVIAPCGTAVTQEQLFLIAYITQRVVICFDGDAAGRLATTRAVNLAKGLPIETTIMSLPPSEDPDSYLLKYGGQALLTNLKQLWSIKK